MATYWVLDFSNIKGFFGHLSARSTEILQSVWEWQRVYRCVSCRTISLPSFSGLCSKLAEIAIFKMWQPRFLALSFVVGRKTLVAVTLPSRIWVVKSLLGGRGGRVF